MSKEKGPMTEAHVAIADDVVVLQLEKEGVTRPAPEAYSREDDPFADRICQAIGYTRLHLVPMAQQLSALGMELELQGKIQVGAGEDYAQVALAYVVAQYPASVGIGQ